MLPAFDLDAEPFRDLDVPTLFLLGGDSPEPFRLASEAVASELLTFLAAR